MSTRRTVVRSLPFVCLLALLGAPSALAAQGLTLLPSWTQQSPASSPGPVSAAAAVYDPATHQTVLFGGTAGLGQPPQTWIWDGTNWTALSPANSPSARDYPSMVYDAALGKVVLFGGFDGNNVVADMWTWDGSNWTQVNVGSPAPSARYLQMMAYDSAHATVVLFGGNDTNNDLNDTWTWDGTAWTQQSPANSPSVRYLSSFAFDATNQYALLFGGTDSNQDEYNDTWTWDGTNWTQQAPANSPPARDAAVMQYDAALGGLLLFGGEPDTTGITPDLQDTWTWSGSNWVQLTVANAPVARAYAQMAYDSNARQMVLYGGQSNTFGLLGDTWTLNAGAPNFGSVALNAAPGSQSLTFVNNGGAVTVASAQALTLGAPGLDYTIVSDACITTLNPGDTCTMTVQFAPTVPGLRRGGIALRDGSGVLLGSAYLVGSGTGPLAAFHAYAQGAQALVSGIGAPLGLAADGAGNLYVADTLNNLVDVVAPSCNSLGCLTSAGGGFTAPNDVALDGLGNLYVSQGSSGTVSVVPAGCTSASCVTALPGAYTDPGGVAVDGIGDVFVTDQVGSVWEVPAGCAAGGCVTSIGAGFSAPKQVAVDAAGHLYLSDSGSILATTPSCTSSGCVSTLVSGYTDLSGLTLDAAGDLYAVDIPDGNLLLEVPAGCTSSSCVVTLLSGLGTPQRVASDASGDLFLSLVAGGMVSELSAVAPTLTFASTNVGSTSSDSPQTVTLSNIGTATLSFPIPGSGSNPSLSPNFSLSNASSCPQLTSSSSSPGTLSAGASCTELLSFTPAAPGIISGSLILTDNSLNASGGTQSISLGGMANDTPTMLAFVAPPPSTLSGPGNAGTITVAEEDAGSNVVSSASDTITLTVTYPDSTMQTYIATASSGVATFHLAGVTLAEAGPYTYTATSSSLTPATANEALVATTATSIGSGQNPAGTGVAVTFTATVSAAGGATGTPSGNVVFSAAGQTAQTVPLIAGAAQATFTFASPANTVVTAAFQGSTYFAVSSNTVTQTTQAPYSYLVTTLTDDASGVAGNCVAGAVDASGGNSSCGLRDAVAAANAVGSSGVSSGTTIRFLASLASSSSPATLSLTPGGALSLTQPVTIQGPGANALTLDGGSASGLATISAGPVAISGLTFRNGASGSNGGAIALLGGSLTLSADAFLSNTGALGGAVFADTGSTSLSVTGSTFSGNGGGVTLSGGAIYFRGSGSVSVLNATFTGNSATSDAAIALTTGASHIIRASTFSGNSAGSGGAITVGAAAQITDSIFTGTISTAANGGAIYDPGSVAAAQNNVYYQNTAAGGEQDCNGCATNTNAASGDPRLSSLANYGGSVSTMIPLPGSTAICAGAVALSANPSAANNQQVMDARGVTHATTYCTSAQVDAGAVQTSFTLGFSQLPPNSYVSGATMTPAPAITLQENSLAVPGGSVALSSTPGTLNGTTTVSTGGSGIATFSGISLTAPSGSATLTALLNLGPASGAPDLSATTPSFTVTTMTLGPGTLPAATVAAAYSSAVSAAGGTAPYTYAVTSGALPAGLSLVTSGAGAGSILGTPSAGGSFNVTFTATDTNSATAQVTETFVVNPPTIVLSPSTLPALQVASTFNATASASGGISAYTYAVTAGTLPAGLSLNSTTGALSGSPTSAGPYNFTITATDSSTGTGPYTGSQSYSGTIAKGNASVTLGGLADTYNGTAWTASATTVPAGLTVTFTYNGSSTAPANAGSYTVVGTVNDPNYAGSATGTLVISPAPLAVTVNAATKVYGTANPTLSGTIAGAILTDGIAATYATTATATSPIGGYPITATLVDPNSRLGNYTVTNTPSTLTITPAALTVTVNAATKVYGTVNPTLSGTITGAILTDGIAATYATTATATSPIGGYPITATLVDPNSRLGNYTVTNTPSTLTVTKASLSVTVNGATKIYGAANPTLTGTITGAVTTDGISATYATTATTTSPVGSYPITATLVDPNSRLGNYTVTNTPSTLAITKATPAVTLTASTAGSLVTNPVTFTATVASTAGTPTGTITFLDGSTVLGAVPLSNGVASLTLTSLAAGSHSVTAVYSGDVNFIGVTSAAYVEIVQDFTFSVGSGSVTSLTVLPGGTATYSFTLTPSSGTTFPAAIALSVSGLPSGATYTLSPTSIAAGAGPTAVTLTITVPSQSGALRSGPRGETMLPMLALLLLPFSRRFRSSARSLPRMAAMLLLLCGAGTALTAISGCGAKDGYFAQPQQSYTVVITGTSGTLSHSSNVTLTVE